MSLVEFLKAYNLITPVLVTAVISGVAGVLTLILTFLLNTWLGRRISHKYETALKEYEGKVKQQVDLNLLEKKSFLDWETERLKHDLHKTAAQISRIQTLQVEVYKQLWQKLALARDHALALNGLKIGSQDHYSLDEMLAYLEEKNFSSHDITTVRESYGISRERALDYFRKCVRSVEVRSLKSVIDDVRVYFNDNEIFLTKEISERFLSAHEPLRKIWSLALTENMTAGIQYRSYEEHMVHCDALKVKCSDMLSEIKKELGLESKDLPRSEALPEAGNSLPSSSRF